VVILPVASPNGNYQIAICTAPDSPGILSASSTASYHDLQLELHAHLELERLAPGEYYFEIRRDASRGEYYPLELK
jgi:hypothetical protein